MKRYMCLLLIVLLFVPCATEAKVYVVDQTNTYANQGNDFGAALGSLLGALVTSSQQHSYAKQQQEYQEGLVKMKGLFSDTAQSEATGLANLLNERTPDEVLELLIAYCKNNNFKYKLGQFKDYYNFVYSQYFGDTEVHYSYGVNHALSECRVVVASFQHNISEDAYRVYQYTPPTPPSAAYAVGEYLGIVFAPEKTAEGHFIVSSVIPNGIAGFAGVKAGDKVTKIDTYDTKEHDVERIASYIILRYNQKATVKATIDRQGQKKVIEIQL